MNDVMYYVMIFILILWFIYKKGWILANFKTINAKEANDIIKNDKDILILDVRSKAEYDISHLKNSILIPSFEIKNNTDKLDKNKTILVYCLSGTRSVSVCRYLNKNGFNSINISGGIFSLQNIGANIVKS